jgi:hypothetical protein
MLKAPKVFDQLAKAIIDGRAKKATKYLSPTMVVKATYQGKRNDRARAHTVVFTVGAPNYAEREFIKQAKQAGESFPVRKIQLKFEKA